MRFEPNAKSSELIGSNPSTEHGSKRELIAPGFTTSGLARCRRVVAVRSASTASC